MPELKPCPRCGVVPFMMTKVFELGKVRDGGYSVESMKYQCLKCGMSGAWWNTQDSAANSWNRRVKMFEEDCDA